MDRREAAVDNVNIYLYTTINTVNTSDGAYGFILEMPREDGNPYTRTEFDTLAKCTGNHAELKAFLNSIRKLKRPCELTIFTDCRYLQCGTRCMKEWSKSGWLTSKGKEVAYKDEWQEVMKILESHIYKFKIKEPHPYRNWLITETNKRRK